MSSIKLREFCIPQKKSDIKAGCGAERGKYKFFTSSNIQSKYYDEALYNQPALIFGTGGKASIHFCDEPFSTSTDCLVFYGNGEVDLKIVYLFLEGHMYLLEEGFKGAGLKHISKDYILDLCLDLPPIEEQKKIAEILDKTSNLISLRKKQIEKLDLLVKAKFIDMFGDPIMNSLKWNSEELQEIADSRLGKMLDGKKQIGKVKYPYLANFNVQWFRFDFSSLNEMEFNEKERCEFSLKNGDLLVCEGGEIGRAAVWKEELENCYFQKALHRVRCNLEIINPYFLAYILYHRSIYNGFEDVIGSKATIAHLTGEKLKKLKIMLPPIELQNQFAYFVEKVEQQNLILQQGLEKLEQNYKSLMQQYFG